MTPGRTGPREVLGWQFGRPRDGSSGPTKRTKQTNGATGTLKVHVSGV